MIIAVDESGDPGLRPGNGTSSHLVIASVCFDENLDAEKMSSKIN